MIECNAMRLLQCIGLQFDAVYFFLLTAIYVASCQRFQAVAKWQKQEQFNGSLCARHCKLIQSHSVLHSNALQAMQSISFC